MNKALRHAQVMLVIDLTTKEYFTRAQVEAQDIRYIKIKANYGEAVERFFATVNDFMADWDGEAEIAVICTYGTNR